MNPRTLVSCGIGYAVCLMIPATLRAQLPDQSAAAFRVEGETVIEWFGHAGRTYFIQVSADDEPLRKWVWAPVIEAGNDGLISYEFGGEAPRGFARLQYTDAVSSPGVSLEDWDADGDGLSNLAELTGTPQTNPLSDDTDGDGLKDGWELAHGLDPTDNGSINPDNGGSGDPDGDGSPNFDEQAGQTHPDSDQQHPPLLITVERGAIQEFNSPAGAKWIRYGASWSEAEIETEPDASLGPQELSDELEDLFPFPEQPPEDAERQPAGQPVPLSQSDHGARQNQTSSRATSHAGHARHWLKISPEDTAEGKRAYQYLKVFRGSFSPWDGDGNSAGPFSELPESVTLETIEVDPATGLSDPLDLLPLPPSQGGNGFTDASLSLVPAGLTTDMNRDGKIDGEDEGRATEDNPWRFWVNDDNDDGETEGDDLSLSLGGSWNLDYLNSSVDGVRDLVDFFPLRLDLETVLNHFPPTHYHYFLNQVASGSSDNGFNVVWYPEALPDGDPEQSNSAGAYLKNVLRARELATRSSAIIPGGGLQIPASMLEAAESGRGVALIECRGATTQSIALEVRKIGGPTLVEISLPLKISRVADMFRWIYVMPGADDLAAGDIPGDPTNWPDADRNGKHFIFVHGYNVSGDASKGWGAEAFKRMFWSGSNARFSAFAWRGNQSQVGPLTPDYQINLENAFGTASSFKQYLDLTEGEKSVAAHSMGNILVGSAMHDFGARPDSYFMLNSAAGKECYDATEANDADQDKKMVHPAWKDYPKPLRASEWHNRAWINGDKRAELTWKGRLRGVIDNGGQTDVYNFYSSGEEVLNNAEENNPDPASFNWSESGALPWLKKNKAWSMQEKRKGLGLTGVIGTSNYGGWAFNIDSYEPAIHVLEASDLWRVRLPSELPQIPSSEYFLFLVSLTHRPFFDDSNLEHAALFDIDQGIGYPGSDHANAHRNKIISQMIPCTTFATGRNGFVNETTLPAERNIDMNVLMKTDVFEWPLSNLNENDQPPSSPASRPWMHSDIREKAFTHNWRAYREFVERGDLK